MDKAIDTPKTITEKPIDEMGDLEEQFDDLLFAAEHSERRRQRFVLAVDATGSMRHIWRRAKDALKTAVDEIKSRSSVPVSICVIGYRDHENEPEDVLEVSDWSDDTDYLKAWIDRVGCYGGGDYPESIGHALEHIIKDQSSPSQIILIGDAPSKAGSWGYNEAAEFGKQKCPIYALYTDVDERLVNCFTKLAKLSGGRAFPLFGDVDLSDIFKTIFSQNPVLEITYQPTSIEAKRMLEEMKKEA